MLFRSAPWSINCFSRVCIWTRRLCKACLCASPSGPFRASIISAFLGTAGAGANPSTILSNASTYFISRLRLLEQQGDASIQARPSILTTENIGAVIDLSETAYIQTTSERTALVTPVTAGTTLRVTPRLIGQGVDSAIRLSVDIEDGQIQTGTGSSVLPTVRRGVVSTEASVKRDESLLIGGYNSVQTVKGKDKIPILGDIPLLGVLFSNASDQIQRRERLFLIRTKVVGDFAVPERVGKVLKTSWRRWPRQPLNH